MSLDPSSSYSLRDYPVETIEDYAISFGPKFGYKFKPGFFEDGGLPCAPPRPKTINNPFTLDSVFNTKVQLYDTNNQLINIEDGFPLQFVNDSFKNLTSTTHYFGNEAKRETFGYIQTTNATFNPIKSSVIAQNNGIYYPTTTTNNNNNKAGFYISQELNTITHTTKK